MKVCGIYGIINIINNKIYIGSSINVIGRWLGHKRCLRSNRHSNLHLQYAWNKYGLSNFEFIILESCAENMLLRKEDAWIDYYRAQDRKYGYNLVSADRHIISEETRTRMSEGGRGKVLSEEHKRKLSESHTGKHHSEETKNKLRSANRGQVPWIFGRTHSKEARKKISEANRGLHRTMSSEHKKNLSWAHMGKMHSQETKIKIGEGIKRHYLISNF